MSSSLHKERYSTFQTIGTIWAFLKPYRGRFVAASFLRLSADIVWLYPAYALATIVTFFATYTPGEPLRSVWIAIGLWAGATLWRMGAMYYGRFWGFRIAQKISLDAQLDSVKHLFSLDMSWHERENTGNKVKRMTKGGDGMQRILRLWIGQFIEIGVNIVGITLILAKFDRTIALATIGFLLTYFLISYLHTKEAKKAAKVENVKDEEFHGLLFETIHNIRSVKVMSMASPLFASLVKGADELFFWIRKRIFWYQAGSTWKNIWGMAFRLGVLSFIIVGITKGHYEIGFLILFNTYFSNIQASVTELADASQEFAIAKYGVGRMADMLATPIVIDIEKGKVPVPKDWKKIVISSLSFSYADKKVLDSVSFEINRGEKIGVVGLSGAGKSTLFKLLLKEHEGYEGEISIDGMPLKSISKKDYFNHIAVVLQDTEVFNLSLKENIVMTNYAKKDNAPLLDKALTVAHVSEFAKSLSYGLDTEIGEKGVRLSGGERQRVGLARAVFKDPELLLLDEATSHLDVESEEKIQDSLHQFFQSVTAVVIAHRLTTIKEMDKIIVLEGGRILEQGTFAELDKKRGRFHELWEKQKL